MIAFCERCFYSPTTCVLIRPYWWLKKNFQGLVFNFLSLLPRVDIVSQWKLGYSLSSAHFCKILDLLQRRITDNLSINGSSFVRFLFAIPLAFVVVLLLVDRIPFLPWTFLGYVIAGGIAQVVGTSCLISAVVKGNFSVGTTLSKTEAAQAALFGLVVLGDAITVSIALGILVSLAGVACLSWSGGSFLPYLSRRALILCLI